MDSDTERRVTELEELDGAHSADRIASNWRLQLGSLGSGNHFVEVSLDEDDRVWAFLHSGSRGVGNKLASKHIKMARELCERRRVELPDRDLAYLSENEDEFWAYIRDLRWAQRFAFLNRQEMMARLLGCLTSWLGRNVTAPRRSTATTTTRRKRSTSVGKSGCPARAPLTPRPAGLASFLALWARGRTW